MKILRQIYAYGSVSVAVLLTGVNGFSFTADAQEIASVDAQNSEIAQFKELYKRPISIPFPKDNPYSPEKASLGKLLYFDTRLSGSNILSCGSCHNPGFGWQDGLPKGVGHEMTILGRRTPTILNVAWGDKYFWDGRAATLEEQALGPIASGVEMNQDLDELVEELSKVDGYQKRFKAVFPNDGITSETIAKAIATYERTVTASRSPFDKWIEGDENAISESAKRGFILYNTKAECALCHKGWNMSDNSFHDIGLDTDDIGRAAWVDNDIKMEYAFKTQGLRDLERRAPFMHNGALSTIEEVVDHYIAGGVNRPSKSEFIRPLDINAAERQDLLAFLNTLTGELSPVVLPVLPR